MNERGEFTAKCGSSRIACWSGKALVSLVKAICVRATTLVDFAVCILYVLCVCVHVWLN